MAKRTNQKGKITAFKRTIKEEGYSSDKKKVIWCFDQIDRDGKFAFDLDRDDFQHKMFMEKLLAYSGMTWSEVKRQTHDDGKSKHHSIEVQKLSKEAQERFAAKKLEEDADSVFSFALDNKLRIVGIRKEECFHILWYDPEHEICPSKKKYT